MDKPSIMQVFVILAGANPILFLVLCWIMFIILIYYAVLFIDRIVDLIKFLSGISLQKKKINQRLKMEQKIYNKFSEISKQAMVRNNFSEASNSMEKCGELLFGKNEEITYYESRINGEEPFSKQSGQSVDRIPDDTEESYAEVAN